MKPTSTLFVALQCAVLMVVVMFSHPPMPQAYERYSDVAKELKGTRDFSGEDAAILCESIKLGRLKDIRKLSEKYPGDQFKALATWTYCDETTPWIYAFKIQNRRSWKYLLRLGLDINTLDSDGFTIRDYLEHRTLWLKMKTDLSAMKFIQIYEEHIAELIREYGAKNGSAWLLKEREWLKNLERAKLENPDYFEKLEYLRAR